LEQRPKRPLEEEKKKKGEEFSGIDDEQKQVRESMSHYLSDAILCII
jgi:hypothetical protein